MKRIISSILILAALICQPLLAQKTDDYARLLSEPPVISVVTTTAAFGTQNKPALEYEITAPEKEYTKHLEKFLKSSFGVKFRRNSGSNEAVGILVSKWSTDSLTMLWNTDSRHEKTMVRVSFSTYRGGKTEEANEQALQSFRSDLENQVRQFYIGYYNTLMTELKRDADMEKRDVSKAEKEIDRNDKLIQTTKRGIESDRANVNRYESAMRNAEDQKKSQENQLKNLEQSKESYNEELNSITEEVTAKQREYDSFNRSGDLNTKQAERVAKDLDKLKSKQEKSRDKVTDINEDIRKQKELILKSNEKYTEAESARRKAESAERDKDQKLGHIEHDLEKSKKKLEDEQREFREATELLDSVKKAFDRFNSGK